jgi:hypothetical protein
MINPVDFAACVLSNANWFRFSAVRGMGEGSGSTCSERSLWWSNGEVKWSVQIRVNYPLHVVDPMIFWIINR